ncbi:MAG: NADH-quinone oxidoreductase subunit [Pseudonocardiales bacterium]|nr:NADH-quinone oxidoreductase subunit [Jatrophihabitantaceae bacterium]MCW2605139.1 NADH-quinone oxidoreductase subunit [Pseudonocardiales bacterium]
MTTSPSSSAQGGHAETPEVPVVADQATPGVGPSEEGAFGTEQRGMFGIAGTGDTSGFGGLVRRPFIAPGAERPYGGYFDDVADALEAVYPDFGDAVTKVIIDRGEITFHVRREHLLSMVRKLRDDPALRFELLSSLSGVDYLGTEHRLHAVYHLTSLTFRRRIRLEVSCSVEDNHIPSVTGVYPTADWQERETWDLFGIIFDGHPGLTRIMMPDDWVGHPQRKDYPLGGIPVEYKGATIPPPDERRVYR